MRNTSKRRLEIAGVVVAIVLAAGALPGCFGWFDLPPVDVEFVVAQGVTMTPGGSLTPGEPLTAYPVLSPVDCNLPDRGQLEDEVRAHAGRLGGLIHLKEVELRSLEVQRVHGGFYSFTAINAWYVTAGGRGIDGAFLGGTSAPDGFGDTIEVVPPFKVDLLKLMDGQLCGAAMVTVDGVVPEEGVTFDVTARLTVRAEVGL